MGSQCRALTQSAELTFGLPAVFRTPEVWQAEMKGEVFDLVQCAQRIYTGAAARTSQGFMTGHRNGRNGSSRWEMSGKRILPCRIDPSQCIVVDWGGLVAHEYAIYQLFSTALGWSAWRAFLPDKFANHKLLITRAIRLLTAATIRPAHARPPHPTWVTAVRQIFRCYHPQGKLLFLRTCFPHYVTVLVPDGIRDVDVLGLRDRILGSQSMKCSMNLIASRVPPR